VNDSKRDIPSSEVWEKQIPQALITTSLRAHHIQEI